MSQKQPNVASRHDELKALQDNISYRNVVIAALGFIVAGAVFYHFVEDMRWLDAFYFTTITLATVGYGDFVPHTDAGKIFTIFYVLIGITIFVVLARIVVGELALRRRQ